jgi:hypothetical protein
MSLKTTLGTGTFSSQSDKLYDTLFPNCPAITITTTLIKVGWSLSSHQDTGPLDLAGEMPCNMDQTEKQKAHTVSLATFVEDGQQSELSSVQGFAERSPARKDI